jgi:4-hydroxybenzoyl-CoA reductase subunit beta
MILPAFRLHRPESLDEALRLAAKLGRDADFLAGGTDMLQNYKHHLHAKDHVIALEGVRDLHGIERGRIGAMERLSNVAGHPVVREFFPGVPDAIGHIASPLIRNSGTVGGNLLVETRCYYYNQTPFWRDTRGSCMKAESDICLVVPQKDVCYAAYSGDLAPILLVLGASVSLASANRRRTVALKDFYRGDGIEKNILEPGEIIVAIEIPEESTRLRAGYRKLRVRDTMDYPEMGVAAALRLDDGCVEELRAATTAVDVVPQFVDYREKYAGRPIAEVSDAVASDMEERADPRKNTSMPVGYRKRMVRVFLRRLFQDLLGAREVTLG